MGLFNGNIVATGALKRIDDALGEIKWMRVAPGHQRRGYGQAGSGPSTLSKCSAWELSVGQVMSLT